MTKPYKGMLSGRLEPNGVFYVDGFALADRMKEAHDSLKVFNMQIEQNRRLTAAVFYHDTGREPKMWDINTPMPVKGDSQILAYVKL